MLVLILTAKRGEEKVLEIEHQFPDFPIGTPSLVVTWDPRSVVNPRWLTDPLSEYVIDMRPGDTCGDAKIRTTELWETSYLFALAHYLTMQTPWDMKVEKVER